jgi:hypothetical protein
VPRDLPVSAEGNARDAGALWQGLAFGGIQGPCRCLCGVRRRVAGFYRIPTPG